MSEIIASFVDEVDITDIVTGGSQTDNLLVDLAAQSAGALDVSASTVTVADDGSFNVDAVLTDVDMGGAQTEALAITQATHDDLQTNANLQVSDVDVSATNPVPIVEQGVAGSDEARTETASGVSPGGTSTLTFQPSASVTAELRGIKIAAPVAYRATINKNDGTNDTEITTIIGGSETETWKPEAPDASLYGQDVDGSQTESFNVVVENLEPSVGSSADIDVTIEWVET